MKTIKKLVEQDIEEQERISPEATRTEFVSGRLHGLRRVLYFISQEEAKKEDPRFDDFWKAYPNKKSKVVAQKIWKRLKVDDELFTKIMSALEMVKKTPQWTKNGGEFIPHPSTWLNQERWNDEVKVAGALPTNTKYDGI